LKPLAKIKWIAAVAQDTSLQKSALHVAVCLCDCLNGQTGRCNPSLAFIMDYAGLSKRSAQDAIKALNEAGWMDVFRGDGRGNHSQYALNSDRVKGAENIPLSDGERVQELTPLENKGCKKLQERVQKTARKGAKNCNPPTPPYKEEPVKEPVKELVKGAQVKKLPPAGNSKKWPLPDWINKDAWIEFEQHRKEIRKPLTDLARAKAAKQIQALNYDQQQQCIDMTIQNHWQGLFPDKVKTNDNGTHQQSRKLSVGERATEHRKRAERIWADEAASRSVGEDDSHLRPPLDVEFRRVGNK